MFCSHPRPNILAFLKYLVWGDRIFQGTKYHMTSQRSCVLIEWLQWRHWGERERAPHYSCDFHILPYSGKFFAIFAIKHQLAKIFSRENFCLQTFLADNELSTVLLSRISSKSTEFDVFCRTSIEQTAENFSRPTINSPQLRIDPRSKLPPFSMAAFQRQQPTRFGKNGNLTIVWKWKSYYRLEMESYYRFDVENTRCVPHFHLGNCRGVVRRRDLVAKIKIAFPACWWFAKNLSSRKFPAIRIGANMSEPHTSLFNCDFSYNYWGERERAPH